MPILELDDGTVLIETLPIMEYLEELYPDPPLIGTDPVSRALVRSWERRCEIGVYLTASRMVLSKGDVSDQAPPHPDASPPAGQRRPGRQGLAGREFFDCRHHAVYRPGDRASPWDVSPRSGLEQSIPLVCGDEGATERVGVRTPCSL